ncbi:GlmL-related ornithine degradation protein [Pelosinus propionicus]|uniref:DNA mismatch repair protein MutL n=1 Tax=Pelosinus propionicus DSM 13327 TaxID=1123291 RepID=A0A1I4JN40_9FIRM|nr:GlmL-related ornithine degradation protein [Pelosinus propionicus]SFL67536.1 conserved hypothetical protein [Pelosinus propionicus DSM 13327]
MKTVDMLIAEIGSTTTVVNAFHSIDTDAPIFVGQGQAATTALTGDVTIGLYQAIACLEKRLGMELAWQEMVASSSAAGGLRMTVHGLVYDMTVKAAQEAALGAGANIYWVTAGVLSDADFDNIERTKPNIILLAGGVDYGEKATVIANARRLSHLTCPIPIIYAGNRAVSDEVRQILATGGISVTIVENVYPRIDQLNIEPTRREIHDVFEKHIVEAPGMQKIRQLVNGSIIPTPGAVMKAAQLLRESIGDLMVLDVGGATTDVHSVAEGNPEITAMQVGPEPFAKRTVEGDLGVYVNADNVLALSDVNKLCKELDCTSQELTALRTPLPATDKEKRFAVYLTDMAVQTAVNRHVGNIEHIYGPTGRLTIARGKDLTGIKWIIGTGGALTRLPVGLDILLNLNASPSSNLLLPRQGQALLDRDYIMASAGMLAQKYPQAALGILRKSLFDN